MGWKDILSIGSKIFLILLHLELIVSCGVKTEKRDISVTRKDTFELPSRLPNKWLDQVSSVHCKCPDYDTMLPNGDYVKYLADDTTCRIYARLGSRVVEFPEYYQCPFVSYDIPSFYYSASGAIFLLAGHGEVYRELYVIALKNDRMVVDRFVTQRNGLVSGEFFAYQLPNDSGSVYVIGTFFEDSTARGYYQNPSLLFKMSVPGHTYLGVKEYYMLSDDTLSFLVENGEMIKLPFSNNPSILRPR